MDTDETKELNHRDTEIFNQPNVGLAIDTDKRRNVIHDA